MTIKKIEDLKKCQIVCRNQEQVKDCLNYLEQLGFNVFHFRFDYCCIIFYEINLFSFCATDTIHSDLIIEYYNKEFVKTLQKFIKEKEEKGQVKEEEKVKDFEVASDGRITKVNNYKSERTRYFIGERIDCGLVFATEEARDKAIFKMKIETKLKNIAEMLNKGRKINWENALPHKYFIYYIQSKENQSEEKILLGYDFKFKRQGAIYCLDENFLEVAKKEIGEDKLIKYFME